MQNAQGSKTQYFETMCDYLIGNSCAQATQHSNNTKTHKNNLFLSDI